MQWKQASRTAVDENGGVLDPVDGPGGRLPRVDELRIDNGQTRQAQRIDATLARQWNRRD
jgi:hypothetical protein